MNKSLCGASLQVLLQRLSKTHKNFLLCSEWRRIPAGGSFLKSIMSAVMLQHVFHVLHVTQQSIQTSAEIMRDKLLL